MALPTLLPSLAHQGTGCSQRHRRTFPIQQLAAGHGQNQGLDLPCLNLETRHWLTPPWEDDKRISPEEWGTEGTNQLGYCHTHTQPCAAHTKAQPSLPFTLCSANSRGKFLVSCLPALCRIADRYTVGSLHQAGHTDPKYPWKCWKLPPLGGQHLSSLPTWSRRIWQTSGVKWRRAARDLLRILRRLYCTVSRAFCSAASDSGLGCLEEACGLRCTRGVTLDGRESPFFVCRERKERVLNTGMIILH